MNLLIYAKFKNYFVSEGALLLKEHKQGHNRQLIKTIIFSQHAC